MSSLADRLSWCRFRWTLRLETLKRAVMRPYHLHRYRKMRAHIPADEFDPSLDMDVVLMAHLTDAERQDYFRNLVWRREQAHRRDLACGAA